MSYVSYNPALDAIVHGEKQISNRTHRIPNVLRFLMKMWCQTHFYSCSQPNVIIRPSLGLHGSLNTMMNCILLVLDVNCLKKNS